MKGSLLWEHVSSSSVEYDSLVSVRFWMVQLKQNIRQLAWNSTTHPSVHDDFSCVYCAQKGVKSVDIFDVRGTLSKKERHCIEYLQISRHLNQSDSMLLSFSIIENLLMMEIDSVFCCRKISNFLDILCDWKDWHIGRIVNSHSCKPVLYRFLRRQYG